MCEKHETKGAKNTELVLVAMPKESAEERGAVALSKFEISVLNATASIDGDYSLDDVCKVLCCENATTTRKKIAESLEKLEAAGLLEYDRAEIIRSFHKAARVIEPDDDGAQDDELSRLIEEGGFYRVEPDRDGEINTLADCLDYIEQHGGDEAERNKAIAKAREFLNHFDGNIDEAEYALHEAEMWIDAIRDDLGRPL